MVNERERLAEDFSITESNSRDDIPERPPKPPMLSNNLFSLFGQAKVIISKNFQGFFGFRYDHSSYYGDVSTPRVGIIYQNKSFTGKILYMEAFRAPKPWDYTSGLGNKNLKPEEINSFEIAGIYEIKKNLRLETSFYRNNLNNLLIKEFLDDSFRWINSGYVRTKGVDFSLQYGKNKFKGTFDITLSNSEDENGKQMPEISKFTFGFSFSYYFNKNFNFALRGRYYGERENPKIIIETGDTKIESGFVLNSSFNFKLTKNMEGQLSILNLFNSTYFHPSNLPPDRYRQPGRTIRLKFSYEF